MSNGNLSLAGAFAPAPTQITAGHLAALSTEVVGVFREHGGREPAGVRSLHFEEHVITILEDGLMPADREVMGAELVCAAERALGRAVLSHRSSLHPEARISFEIFLVDDGTESW